MTEELDYETLERFAMAVEHWPPDEAQAEYNRLVAKEKARRRVRHESFGSVRGNRRI